MKDKKSYDRVTHEGVEARAVTVTFRKDLITAAAKLGKEINRSKGYVLADLAAEAAIARGLVPKDPPRLPEEARA